jgi:hypothetical protein
MHKNATKCNKTQSKWCINKHGASKIIDTFETYHYVVHLSLLWCDLYVIMSFVSSWISRCYSFHLLCYSIGFILVISWDTLSHDVKVTVCALCVSLRLNFTVILIMSYDLSWMSLWIVGVCLKLSSALKVTVWSNLDWGMQTLRSAFLALHMISVRYPTRE